jgi:hypothetical protein
MPNKTSGEGQLLSWVEWFAFAVMMTSPWNQKGTRSGVPGFMGYGLSGGGID